MAHPFQSARLLYRAAEPTSAEDQALFLTIQTDAAGYQNSNFAISRPQGKKSAEDYLKGVAEECLLGVVICLPAPADTTSTPIPIGAIFLDQLKPALAHHRHAEIGINIVPAYQGLGYGNEAIRWISRWAFRSAGLHRVSIRAFSYNEGAVRLYEKLGFQKEGVSRESVWFEGRWWDGVQFGMLAREWREMQEQEGVKQ
ncbi:hypothetical protein LTR36_008209 [Oleoguttula mirabilis]|uniref:N-acetyltransferase domain-containing protein n=1 Tax=Oleoguttula mirabilis TaxID=1507867 RepID=A0AAV9J8W6_9PEZI|nr:hypothetical protein LTR36_008209 [Oleoguttula mirabilis]